MIEEKYLGLLQKQFSTPEAIMTEIINLKAILNLPKGTEHFMSDLHGEYDAFQHMLRSGSGNVREKIRDCFMGVLKDEEQAALAFLIYYPEEMLREVVCKDVYWAEKTIGQLLILVKFTASKYTRSKLRKALPQRFAYVMEELLYQTNVTEDKQAYYAEIIREVVKLGQVDAFIIDLAYAIQQLVVDHLHVVGDIYDRGPAPDRIVEHLMTYHSVDIQWGNHDIIWMGAAAGSALCMINVLRISARYNNLGIIEDTYGINLRPLLTFSEKYYSENEAFRPKNCEGKIGDLQCVETMKMQQALAIIQFKLEGQLVKRRPEFEMEHRNILDEINYTKDTVRINGVEYKLTHTCFKTIYREQPDMLTAEESELVTQLLTRFASSEKLRRHIDFLMEKGAMYLVYNNNLLLHGCIPLHVDCTLKTLHLEGVDYSGKALLDYYEVCLRQAYASPEIQDDIATDMFWYLWSGEKSSLFGKTKMTTFERYFIADKSTHEEYKNPYYALRETEATCQLILKEFGLTRNDARIINGHTPVKEIKGENPIKANGKLIVIDGGYSKPYQKTTGLAGYTLLNNSYGMQLVAHPTSSNIAETIAQKTDILSVKRVIDEPLRRKKVKHTTIGQKIAQEITDLERLLEYTQQ